MIETDDSSDAGPARPVSDALPLKVNGPRGEPANAKSELQTLREALEYSGMEAKRATGRPAKASQPQPPASPLVPLSDADLELERLYFNEWRAGQATAATAVVYSGFDCPTAGGKCALVAETAATASPAAAGRKSVK